MRKCYKNELPQDIWASLAVCFHRGIENAFVFMCTLSYIFTGSLIFISLPTEGRSAKASMRVAAEVELYLLVTVSLLQCLTLSCGTIFLQYYLIKKKTKLLWNLQWWWQDLMGLSWGEVKWFYHNFPDLSSCVLFPDLSFCAGCAASWGQYFYYVALQCLLPHSPCQDSTCSVLER